MTIVQHRPGGTHIDGNAQCQIFWLHFQRPQARFFLRQTYRRNHASRPAGALLVHFLVPAPQLQT